MGRASSYHDYGTPSAILSDGILTVPLWAVTSLSLTESYALPMIEGTSARAIVADHDDAVSLNGLLVGPERHTWKLALETLAEASKRGGALSGVTGGRMGGLILSTSMTIRTDMQVQQLAFTVNATRREVIDVRLSLVHMPSPGFTGRLLDVASLAVGALADWSRS